MTATDGRSHTVCWTVPIRRDSDGSVLVLCHTDQEAGARVDVWAVWCPDCRSVLPGTDLPGTEGLSSIEDLPEEAWELVHAHELRSSAEHAAALSGASPALLGARAAR